MLLYGAVLMQPCWSWMITMIAVLFLKPLAGSGRLPRDQSGIPSGPAPITNNKSLKVNTVAQLAW